MIARRLEESRELLIGLVQALVRTPSPNPPGDTTRIAAVIREVLAAVPEAEVREVVGRPPYANVAARLCGAGPGRRLVFNGHLDTFPVGEDLPWTRPPLGALVEDGRIYGRGVSDMKGGIACALLAFILMAEVREAWNGELVLTLAGDEESMGSNGTKLLLDTVPFAAGDAMICGDAGSADVVRFGEKGLLWLEIEAVGRAAHGAHVHLGQNAIDRLRAALDALDALRALPVPAPASVTRAIREAKPVSERIAGEGEAGVLGSVTVNIGTISGGVSTNLVPAQAGATADVRLPAGVCADDVERELDRLLSPLAGVSWRVVRRFDPSWTDPGHEIVRRLVANARRVNGRPPAVNMRVGASDARWYRMQGVPAVVYGPTPHNMGGADEYVSVDELHAVAAVQTLTAFEYLTS